MSAGAFANLVNMSDVRMVESRRRCCFLFESAHPIFIGDNIGGQNFQRNFAMKLSVLRQVHLTHSACAKLRADFVPTEFSTAVNCHFRNSLRISTTSCPTA